MKIQVFTQPLGTNYGGILQAYALKHVLESKGHQVFFLDWYSKGRPSGFVNTLKYLLRRLATFRLERFVNSNFSKLYVTDWSPELVSGYGAVIVGSDQVWRCRYNRSVIRHAFCDYCISEPVLRISYAASFGLDEPDMSGELMAELSSLLKKFDSVSVREDSAVDICRSMFGVEAGLVLDPTLLLDVGDYMRLAGISDDVRPNGGLLVCALDESKDLQAIVDCVSRGRGLKPFRNNSRFEVKGSMPWQRIQPSVKSWIKSFYDADFVITDSFHACVFSLIFNKPFIVVGNRNRGFSRFLTLTKTFGCQQNLVESAAQYSGDTDYSVDRGTFEKTLERMRFISMKYLEALDA